jgi:tetratricopeptide (TPR) repeat protein
MRFFAIATLVFFAALCPAQGRVDDMKAGYDREMDLLIDRYFHEGNYEKVAELLKTYTKRHPDDAQLSTNYAWMLFNIGKEGESILEGVRFVRDNPKSEIGKLQLAQQYFDRKLYARVPGILEPIIGTTKAVQAFIMLGRSYEVLGLLKSALRVHEARAKLFPDDLVAKRQVDKVKQMLAGKV